MVRWSAPGEAQPIAAGGEIGERSRRRPGQFIAQRGRHARPVGQRLANLGVVAKALEDAPQRAGAQIGVEIGQQRDDRFPLSDLGQSRRQPGRQLRPAGDGGSERIRRRPPRNR